MKYYIFTEHNDYEGETWNFYIPMEKLHRDIIAQAIESTDEFDSPYEISDKAYDEVEVDFIIRNIKGTSSYMSEFNKCNGINQQLLDKLLDQSVNITENDPFYKGSCWDIIPASEIKDS